jgi:hypothetical protein
VKGQSGNPGGKTKKYHELRKLAQEHSVEALERVVEIMRDGRALKTGLKAAEIILDRAFGKVPYAVTGEGGEGPVQINYEVSWRHHDTGGLTLDLEPRKEPILLESAKVEDE